MKPFGTTVALKPGSIEEIQNEIEILNLERAKWIELEDSYRRLAVVAKARHHLATEQLAFRYAELEIARQTKLTNAAALAKHKAKRAQKTSKTSKGAA